MLLKVLLLKKKSVNCNLTDDKRQIQWICFAAKGKRSAKNAGDDLRLTTINPQKENCQVSCLQCSNISSYNLLLFRRPAGSPLAATAPSKVRKVEQSPLVRPTTAAGSRLPRAASRKRNAKVKHRLL